MRILFVLSLFLAFTMPAQSQQPTLAEKNNQFALDLYKQLGAKPGNLFFSPYSLSAALGMTYTGAKGDTAAEMAKVMHFPADPEKLAPEFGQLIQTLQGPGVKREYQLSTANAIWAQEGLSYRPDFLRITQTNYQAGLKLVNYGKNADGVRLEINRWVEKQTNDKIKDLIAKGALTADTRMVLANAIYFYGDWATPFEKKSTQTAKFQTGGKGAVDVAMMNNTAHFQYMENDTFQLVSMPYKGNELSMVVLLPKKVDGLDSVEKSLTENSLRTAIGQLAGRRVHISLPKVKMTQDFQLGKTLVAMGMQKAFSDKEADFSGIADTSRERLYISEVVHKAFVAVDEKGTEAAAATAVLIFGVTSAIPQPPVRFNADHPYLFAIRHNATGSILFLGRVNDPR